MLTLRFFVHLLRKLLHKTLRYSIQVIWALCIKPMQGKKNDYETDTKINSESYALIAEIVISSP